MFSNRSIIDGILTGSTILGQSGPGSNGNIGELHTQLTFRSDTSSLDAVWCHTQETPFDVCGCVCGGLPLCKGCIQCILRPANRAIYLYIHR